MPCCAIFIQKRLEMIMGLVKISDVIKRLIIGNDLDEQHIYFIVAAISFPCPNATSSPHPY